MISETAEATIRLLEERDLESLARSLGLSRHHIAGRWHERLQGERTASVAEMDGEAVGSVSFEERREIPGLMHLYALVVVEPSQSRGIGTRLIASVEEEARGRKLAGIHLGVATDNIGALRLYERLGYKRVGEPYMARWMWYGPDGEEREISERCFRMVKRFRAARKTAR